MCVPKNLRNIKYYNENVRDNKLVHSIFVHSRLLLFRYLYQFCYSKQITAWLIRPQDFANI